MSPRGAMAARPRHRPPRRPRTATRAPGSYTVTEIVARSPTRRRSPRRRPGAWTSRRLIQPPTAALTGDTNERYRPGHRHGRRVRLHRPTGPGAHLRVHVGRRNDDCCLDGTDGRPHVPDRRHVDGDRDRHQHLRSDRRCAAHGDRHRTTTGLRGHDRDGVVDVVRGRRRRHARSGCERRAGPPRRRHGPGGEQLQRHHQCDRHGGQHLHRRAHGVDVLRSPRRPHRARCQGARGRCEDHGELPEGVEVQDGRRRPAGGHAGRPRRVRDPQRLVILPPD